MTAELRGFAASISAVRAIATTLEPWVSRPLDSLDPVDDPLPDEVASGGQVFRVVGAMAGG